MFLTCGIEITQVSTFPVPESIWSNERVFEIHLVPCFQSLFSVYDQQLKTL